MKLLKAIRNMFKKKPLIVVVRLDGVIGAVSRFGSGGIDDANTQKLMEKAFEYEKAKAIVIKINSPGGSPTQSSLIASRIIKLSKDKKIPVIAFCEDVAASGGYWLACASEEIYADVNSIIGSIGVISASFGFKNLIEKIGIERRVYTAGKNKSTLDPFLDEKEEDINRLKNIQLEIHQDFIDVVEESRKEKLNKNSGIELFSGEFWAGKKAKELGLIDGLGNADQILREKYGEEIEIKKFGKSKGWLSKKLSSSENYTDKLISLLEERSIWQRYGL